MIFRIYTILVILQQYKCMTTDVPDPCLSNIKDDAIVVDMCTSSCATENLEHSGSFPVDSVILRIVIQDNCICRVKIDNQIQAVSIGLRKYDGLTSSAPEEYGCGLEVDIHHIPNRSAETGIAPIECVVNSTTRNIGLLDNSYLQFKSRIINGTFTRGYCMRIQRDINSDSKQVLRIDCDAPTTTEKTLTCAPANSSPLTIESVKSTTKSSSIDATATAPATDTTSTDPTTGLEQTTYIAIGAGSGVALLLLVVLVVVCLRRKSTQRAGTNGYVDNSHQEDESDDKLPDNVLYVSAREFDITGGRCSTADVDTTISSIKRVSMEGNNSTVDEDTRKSPNERLSVEGNYSTVDADMPKSSTNRLSMDENYSTVELDKHCDTNSSYTENSELGQAKRRRKPTIKPKPKSSCINSEENHSSDQNIKHITPPSGSDNLYAVVDKSSKNAPTANGSKGEGICQPDQTYAVVDKARERKSSTDETIKKKFEIHSVNRV